MNAHNGSHAAPRRGSVVRAPGPDREEALVARLTDLGPALDGEPDPAFRAATRARLVAMAAVRTPEPAQPARRRRSAPSVESLAARWRSRLTAGLAGAAVAVTALAGLVAVSTGAQPGDPLYGLKRGTEQTQLALASDSSRGRTLLDFASTRLHELDRLLSEGTTALPAAGGDAGGEGAVLAAGTSPELVIQTLQTMDSQTTEGVAWLTTRAQQTGSASPLDFLAQWTAGQSSALSALVPKVPEGAGDAMGTSLALLTQVDARSTALQAALACPAGPATAGTDALGPLPADCTEQPPASASGGTSDPGAVPGTGQTSTDLPATDVPAVPTPGAGADGGSSSSSAGGGSGGSTAATVPRTTVPSVPTPSLPLPLPSISVSVPGGSNNGGSGSTPSSGSTPTTSPPPLVSICLGPIVLGRC